MQGKLAFHFVHCATCSNKRFLSAVTYFYQNYVTWVWRSMCATS